MINKLKIEGISKEKTKILYNYLFNETDLGDLGLEFARKTILDFYMYGYQPWDYIEELKLNLKYQK